VIVERIFDGEWKFMTALQRTGDVSEIRSLNIRCGRERKYNNEYDSVR
jgi:hypothetical protein